MTIKPIEQRTVDLPEDVTVTIDDDGTVTVQGPGGEHTRRLHHPKIEIEADDDELRVYASPARRKIAALVGTYRGHLQNMVDGVSDPFEAQLKIVSSHFPIKARVDNDEVVIDNFLGEKAPRRADILGDTEVQVSGEDVTVTGPNKEHVGQTASNIEKATYVSGFDPRVFQDGIYITKKPR